MGHSKIETAKNIYGHLLAQPRSIILDAMNQAVSRLYAYEDGDPGAEGRTHAVAWNRLLALQTVGPRSWDL